MNLLLPLIATAILTTTQPTGLGFSIAHQRGDAWAQQSLTMLQPPAWKDWTWAHAGEAGYIPEVYTMQSSAWNDTAMPIAREVGGVWLLGSEPELRGTYVEPVDAAQFSKRWASDVGGIWGAPGIISNDSGYAWLNAYLGAGGLVGTHWHIHLYGVQTPDQWEAKWDEWRDWMIAHDLVRPTIISETAGWWMWDGQVHTASDDAGIMDRIAEIQARDPLLQTVLWYSDKDWWNLWNWANLRTNVGLTGLGEHYVALQANLPVMTPEAKPDWWPCEPCVPLAAEPEQAQAAVWVFIPWLMTGW